MLEYFFLRESWLAKARPSLVLTRIPSALYFISLCPDGDSSFAVKGTSPDVVVGVGWLLGFAGVGGAPGTTFGRPLEGLTDLLVSFEDETASALSESLAGRGLQKTTQK